MFIFFQLFVLVIVSVVLTTLVKRKGWAIFLAIVLGFFFTLQMISVLVAGNLIDYKFFLHFDVVEAWEVIGSFLVETGITLSILLVAPVMVFQSATRLKRYKTLNPKISLTIVGLGLILMSFSDGVIRNLYDITRLALVGDRSFNAGLVQLGIPPKQYTLTRDIKASRGKNIIVISMESLEKGYFEKSLEHLTPNLRKLAHEMTYFDMIPTTGSSWTAGSIYTTVTGMPSFFKGQANESFKTIFDVKIPGISHILKNAGYDVTYLMGKKEFAGVNDMLTAYQFDVKSEADFTEKYPPSRWGLHDKDLFNEAKKALLAAKQSNQPYALFLSTVDTHVPDGVYDSRMEKYIQPQPTELEFTVASLDYLINDFFEFLSKEGILSSTAVYLFPDHLLMGARARVLNEFSDPRGMYLITNVKENKFTYDTKEAIYQIDIPKIILEGAGVKHNVKFLTDFIDDPEAFIKAEKTGLLALNEASVKTETFKEGMHLRLVDDTTALISSSEHTDTLQVLNKKDTFLVLSFDKNMALTSRSVSRNFAEFKNESDEAKLFIQVRDGKMFTYLKKGKSLGIAKQGAEVAYSHDDLRLFTDWEVDKKLPKPPYPYANPFEGTMIYLTSTGNGPQMQETPTEIRVDSRKFKHSRGVNVLFRNSDRYTVENFDTHGDSIAAIKLINRLNRLSKDMGFYALVVHDSGEKQLRGHQKELLKLGFDQLTTLRPQEAYIAFSYKGVIGEYKNRRTISLSFPERMPVFSRSDAEIQRNAKDPMRFIAHAGGKVDELVYTNSLEALNESYKKGFKLFELDMITTSDGVYVASHDWAMWARQSSYKGSIPPTHAEFMKTKIRGRLTPLDMKTINKWFRDHPDAILVTDKVNEPKKFSRQFVDKRRLMMEIFTLDSLRAAQQLGLRAAIASYSVYSQVNGDKLKFFKDHGVTHVAVSRRIVASDIPLYEQLHRSGIKTYVYHVNYDPGKDEAYVVLNEMDYVYGLYADDWYFKAD